jgi:putative spermidine/putrescine transport system substrate-binding protein
MNSRRNYLRILACALFLLLAGCQSRKADARPALAPAQLATLPWTDLEQRARGTTVNFAMWAGDENRNRYFQEKVAAELKRRFDITLRIIPLGDTAEAVNKLLTEKAGSKSVGGSMDMLWINGENFRTARQGSVLWGPFADHLPNIRYFDEQARGRDFGTNIDGYEAPWERAQFVIAYDSARTSVPPRSIEALRSWIKQHPGHFTYPAPPDFTGSVFIRHVLIQSGGGASFFQSAFDEKLYQKASARTIDYLNDIKPFLWRRGETYPSSPSEMNRLFANGEIDFSMSYGPAFASEHIARGDFPPTTRTYVFDEGTIGNFSFLAIPFNATNSAGALVVINFLMSPEQELDQTRVLGDIFPIGPERLTPEQRHAVESLPMGPATLPAAELRSHQLPEPDAQYSNRLQQDWIRKVLEK